ncbi:MAG: riboflavin biosynthesis protein RibF [Paludibacteraceae bacterium]|nr:riboflavin biosynthesis protein RibF [Paludibacteraceae bacterium]
MPAIATIGFFDGVHKGHHYLFEQLRRYAAEYDERPLIFTFLQHPRTVLAKLQGNDDFCPSLLTTTDEREQLLGQFGDVHFFDFAEVQPLTAAQFLDYLADRWKVRHLLMGYNHRFGSDGRLTDEQYAAIARQVGIRILRADSYGEDGLKPSSTVIRNLLVRGDIAAANRLLGYEYMLTGRVVHGRMIGRQIGFPTANIVPAPDKLIPTSGVYKAVVSANGQQLMANGLINAQALVNIGTNPTVGNTHQTIEVHIPDFSGDLYNQSITLHFTERLREERRFDSLDDLRKQIQCDLAALHPNQ